MYIEYLGHSCFFLKGESFSVVTDPYGDIGLKLKRVRCNYALVSHGHFDHNNVGGVDADEAVYSSTDRFTAIPCWHDEVQGKKRGANTAFYFEMDGLKIMHLGDLGEPFDDKTADKFRLPVDVLFLPVGGKYTVDAAEADKYAKYIGAKVTVIMHYKLDGCGVDVAPADEFLSLQEEFKDVQNGVEITKENVDSFPRVIRIKFN